MFRQYMRQSDDQFSYPQYPAYLKTTLILIGSMLICWAYAYVSWALLTPQTLTWISYRGVWLTLSFISYALAYFAIQQPELFKVPPEPVVSSQQGLADTELVPLKEALHHIMRNQKPYLEPTLKLAELAEVAEITPHRLSRVINEGYQQNFSDVVNRYRVEAQSTPAKMVSSSGWAPIHIIEAPSRRSWSRLCTGGSPSGLSGEWQAVAIIVKPTRKRVSMCSKRFA